MGYAGGNLENPTYHHLGDHTETIQIDFSPKEIAFSDLLRFFWDGHSPFRQPWSRQYAGLVICRDAEQMEIALESKRSLEERFGKQVWTEILPASRFYPAEGYHQKYYLQHLHRVHAWFRKTFPENTGFVNSTAAARVNGYAGGYGSELRLMREIDRLGLFGEAKQELLDRVSRRHA